MRVTTLKSITDEQVTDYFESYLSGYGENHDVDILDVHSVLKDAVSIYLQRLPAYHVDLENGRDYQQLLLPYYKDDNDEAGFYFWNYRVVNKQPKLQSFRVSRFPQPDDLLSPYGKKQAEIHGLSEEQYFTAFQERFVTDLLKTVKFQQERKPVYKIKIKNLKYSHASDQNLFGALDDHVGLLRQSLDGGEFGFVNIVEGLLARHNIPEFRQGRRILRDGITRLNRDRIEAVSQKFMTPIDNNTIETCLKTRFGRNEVGFTILNHHPELRDACEKSPMMFDAICLHPSSIKSFYKNKHKGKPKPFSILSVYNKVLDNAVDPIAMGLVRDIDPLSLPESVAKSVTYNLGWYARLFRKLNFNPKIFSDNDWRNFHTLAQVANSLSPYGGNHKFHDSALSIAQDLSQNGADFSLVKKYSRNSGQARLDVAAMRKALATTVILPKFLNDIDGKNKGLEKPQCQVDFVQAAYVAAGLELDYETWSTPSARLKRLRNVASLRESVTDNFLMGYTLREQLQIAYQFQRQRHRLVNDDAVKYARQKAMFSKGDQSFPVAPSMQIGQVDIKPILSRGDLLMDAQNHGHNLWHNPDRLMSGSVFMMHAKHKETRDGIATFEVIRDDDGTFKIGQMELFDKRSHNSMPPVLQQYVDTIAPLFDQSKNQFLINSLQQAVADFNNASDIIGHEPDDTVENERCVRFFEQLFNEEWTVDDMGCLSSPRIDAKVRQALSLKIFAPK